MLLGVFTASSEIDLVLRNSGSSGALVINTSSNNTHTHKTVTCSVVIHSVPRLLNDTLFDAQYWHCRRKTAA